MKKEFILIIVLAIIIVVLLGFFFLLPAKNNPQPIVSGIEITSPKENSEISSPLEIQGVAYWGGFEGQAGTVKLYDNNGNLLGTAILTATSDTWTSTPITFKTTLIFRSDKDQLGALIFHNENPSGLPQYDTQFVLPVKIKASGETMTVKAYFMNDNLDPQISCDKVFSVQRTVPKTQAVAIAALEELLKGPTNEEKSSGFNTAINDGVKIQSLTIENGVAKVDFNQQLQEKVGGSCRVTAIRKQIEETLKQFSSVKDVVISIDGNSNQYLILQP